MTTEVNPYEALIAENAQRRDALRNATLHDAVTINPDAAAATNRTAQVLGVPPAVVAATPEDSQREAQIKRVNADLARYPTLARHFEKQELAEVAHDDTPVLGQITELIGNAAGYVMGARKGGGLPGAIASIPWVASEGFAGVFKAIADNTAPALDPLVGHGLSSNPLRDVGDMFGKMGETAGATAKSLARPTGNLVEDAVTSGIQSAGANLMLLPATIVNPVAGLTAMTAREGGEDYLE